MTPHQTTTQVGVRRLRDHLSEYLALVREGTEIVVTDRGRPVARIVSNAGGDRLQELIERGLVTPASSPKRSRTGKRLARARGSVSELVAEQRR